jgi:hypothetical protein
MLTLNVGEKITLSLEIIQSTLWGTGGGVRNRCNLCAKLKPVSPNHMRQHLHLVADW